MQWLSLAVALAIAVQDARSAATNGDELRTRQFAQAAMMRFDCSQLVIERLDPLVTPGMLPSPHMHQIAGGNSFNASMPPVDYDPSKLSSCTSCTYSEDCK